MIINLGGVKCRVFLSGSHILGGKMHMAYGRLSLEFKEGVGLGTKRSRRILHIYTSVSPREVASIAVKTILHQICPVLRRI